MRFSKKLLLESEDPPASKACIGAYVDLFSAIVMVRQLADKKPIEKKSHSILFNKEPVAFFSVHELESLKPLASLKREEIRGCLLDAWFNIGQEFLFDGFWIDQIKDDNIRLTVQAEIEMKLVLSGQIDARRFYWKSNKSTMK